MQNRLSLIERGQKDEFENVVRAEYQRVYRFAYELTRNKDDAIDLTQETFRAALQAWNRFRGQSKAATWLHSILYRKFIDENRRSKVRERALKGIGNELISNKELQGTSDALHVVATQVRHDVQSALMQLDELERVIVVARYLQGFSVVEIAQLTDMPIGTVKWRNSVALKKLRNFLNR